MDSKQVRIREGTWERLEAVRRHIMRKRAVSMTMDAVIAYLIDGQWNRNHQKELDLLRERKVPLT